MNSNFIVVLLPAGKGSHVELGIAIGNGINIFLYSQNDEIDDLENTSAFYHADGICKCKGTVEELIQIILKELKTNKIIFEKALTSSNTFYNYIMAGATPRSIEYIGGIWIQ